VEVTGSKKLCKKTHNLTDRAHTKLRKKDRHRESRTGRRVKSVREKKNDPNIPRGTTRLGEWPDDSWEVEGKGEEGKKLAAGGKRDLRTTHLIVYEKIVRKKEKR